MYVQTPASRATDPETSRMAEQMMNESGRRRTHQDKVRDQVRANPGSTAAEIGEATGLGHIEAQRRLSDLVGIDVEQGEKRACSIKGTTMVTWWPKGMVGIG